MKQLIRMTRTVEWDFEVEAESLTLEEAKLFIRTEFFGLGHAEIGNMVVGELHVNQTLRDEFKIKKIDEDSYGDTLNEITGDEDE